MIAKQPHSVPAMEFFGRVASSCGVVVVNDHENHRRLKVLSPAWAIRLASGFDYMVWRAATEDWNVSEKSGAFRVVNGAAKLAGFEPKWGNKPFDQTATQNVNQLLAHLAIELTKHYSWIVGCHPHPREK